MKISKTQLKRIIREERQKLLRESGVAYGSIPMASFKSVNMGYLDMRDEAMDLFTDMLDGSVYLMTPEDYDNLLAFVQDMADDGEEDFVDFRNLLVANRQGQYIRVALR